MKIVFDDRLWKALWKAAVRFTGYVTPGEVKEEEPLNALEELERQERNQRTWRERQLIYDNATYLWICNKTIEDQERIISYLCRAGVIKDVEAVRRQIADWYKRGSHGRAYPTEAAPMSDDVLDRCAQYLHINRNLFDDPEQFSEEYIH